MSTAFLAITGIVLTMLGVSGVEHSLTTVELVQSVAISMVGLCLMACAVTVIQQENSNL